MPKIIKPNYSQSPMRGVTGQPIYKMRIYKRPGDFMEKEYRGINQMERWRQYYKDQGFRTRRI